MGDEDVVADREAPVLLEIARAELGRPRRNGRAQHQQLTGREQRQQVVEHGADLAHVDLDVREGGGTDGQDDRLGIGSVGRAVAQVEAIADACEQRIGTRFGERHAAVAQRREALGILVDAEHA